MDPAAIPEAVLLRNCKENTPDRELLLRAVGGGTLSPEDMDVLVDDLVCFECGRTSAKRKQAERERIGSLLEWLSRPAEFGRLFLRGLSEFRESFYREEERRIGPAVEAALNRARERASVLSVKDLLEELSQGLRMDYLVDRPCLLLVPCYWCSPRIIQGCVGSDCRVILFGARPPDASLVPEDQVPGSLYLALAALADPTRLNILRVLREEPLTQAQIARRLRLRPPTISHHLKSLRIAGLTTVLKSEGSETLYATRTARVGDVCDSLRAFLQMR